MVRPANLRRLLALAAACVLAPTASQAASTPPPPRPAIRIPVAPLGFTGPARLYMPYRIPEATLGFLDANHLLFTFHVARLMHRLDNDPPDDLDQTIHAVVIALPGGKAVAQTDWRLHDRDHYLWTLGNGTFLFRERNALFSGDASLHLKPYLDPSEGHFIFGMLSPDHTLFEAEYSVPVPPPLVSGDQAPAVAPTLGDDAPRFTARGHRYNIYVVNTATLHAQRFDDISSPVILTLMPQGFLTAEQAKAREWTILLNPWKGAPRTVATVTSTCSPSIDSLSSTTMLVTTCLPFNENHTVVSLDLSGTELWRQVWQSRFVWGTYAFSRLGNRFAYGSIELDHSLVPGEESDASSVLGEPVGVFETATGKLDMVLDANPVLTAGDNFALSPSGDRFAILRQGAVEIYNLPPAAGFAGRPHKSEKPPRP